MKRIYTLLMLCIFSMTLFAQTNPNRLLVRETTGNLKGYLVENIDSIFFDKEEGRVAADLEFLGYSTGETGDTIRLAVTRTEKCVAYRIMVVPTTVANRLNTDAAVGSYLEQKAPNLFYDNFTNAEMTGFDEPSKENSDYTIFTSGLDKFGISCSASRVDFHTPKTPVTGNPQVDYTIDDVTYNTVTITFRPNEDTGGYSYCLFDKGELQAQYEQFGAMFGFSSIGEMVRAWGIACESEYTYTYPDLKAGKEYDLFVQPWDVNGVNADMSLIPVMTKAYGGPGLAEVEISIGDFKANDEGRTYQLVTITPNENVSLYHAAVMEKDKYEQNGGDATMLEYLVNDKNPDNPWDQYWDMYGVDNSGWYVDPSKTYIVAVAAKNINNEWGPLATKEFTTPGAPKAAPAKVMRNGMQQRIAGAAKDGAKQLALPKMAVKKTGDGMKLIQK